YPRTKRCKRGTAFAARPTSVTIVERKVKKFRVAASELLGFGVDRPIRKVTREAATMADDKLLKTADVARMFRVDPKTVTRWAVSGKISAVQTLGGHRRYYLSEIERAIEAGSADDRESFGNG